MEWHIFVGLLSCVHAGELKEEFLMCKSLETTTKIVDILEKVDNFFQ